MRDGLPILPGRYNPHTSWRELLDHREKGLAKRHVAKKESWSEHTRQLSPLTVGDKVFIQNQTGNNPRRWERTGIILEAKDYDQYLVKVDGTGRATLRNRKFLRKFTPINNPTPASPSTPITTPSFDTPSSVPPVTQPAIPTAQTASPSLPLSPVRVRAPTYSPEGPSTLLPESDFNTHDAVPAPLVFDEDFSHHVPVPAPLVQDEYVQVPPHQQSPTPRATLPSPPTLSRPKRNIKPSTKLDPDVWDLSRVTQSSTPLSMEWCLEMIRWIAENVETSSKLSGQEDSPGGGR